VNRPHRSTSSRAAWALDGRLLALVADGEPDPLAFLDVPEGQPALTAEQIAEHVATLDADGLAALIEAARAEAESIDPASVTSEDVDRINLLGDAVEAAEGRQQAIAAEEQERQENAQRALDRLRRPPRTATRATARTATTARTTSMRAPTPSTPRSRSPRPPPAASAPADPAPVAGCPAPAGRAWARAPTPPATAPRQGSPRSARRPPSSPPPGSNRSGSTPGRRSRTPAARGGVRVAPRRDPPGTRIRRRRRAGARRHRPHDLPDRPDPAHERRGHEHERTCGRRPTGRRSSPPASTTGRPGRPRRRRRALRPDRAALRRARDRLLRPPAAGRPDELRGRPGRDPVAGGPVVRRLRRRRRILDDRERRGAGRPGHNRPAAETVPRRRMPRQRRGVRRGDHPLPAVLERVRPVRPGGHRREHRRRAGRARPRRRKPAHDADRRPVDDGHRRGGRRHNPRPARVPRPAPRAVPVVLPPRRRRRPALRAAGMGRVRDPVGPDPLVRRRNAVRRRRADDRRHGSPAGA
jgi:hypothetical protein